MTRVTLVGGNGFIGRRLAGRLAGRGTHGRVVSRRGGAAAPQVEQAVGDIRDDGMIARAAENADAVVYLAGTTSAKSEAAFRSLHCDAPRRLAEAAHRAGATRFLFVSAMGVARDAPAMADRSKAKGEDAVRAAFPGANVIRPALVYGPGDHFFTMFAGLVRGARAIPLIGGGRTRFQPMHVDDAAESMARIIEDPATAGRTFELGADETFTFRELIERLCAALGRRPWLVPVPFAVAETGAFLTQWLPIAPLTLDQVRLLKTDKVMRAPANGPGTLNVRPRALAGYLEELGAQ